MAMIEAACAGDFDVIVCRDLDRFSRFDPMEASYYFHQLRQAGVRLLTVNDGWIDWDDIGNYLKVVVDQHAKHAYAKSMGLNIGPVLFELAQEGYWVSGTPPFGFGLKRTGADNARRLGQLSGDLPVIQRRQQLALGEIAGAAEDDVIERFDRNDLAAHGRFARAEEIRFSLNLIDLKKPELS